jgi:hypothetical protein
VLVLLSQRIAIGAAEKQSSRKWRRNIPGNQAKLNHFNIENQH